MAVQLNHTIVRSHDKVAGARFLAEILGLAVPDGSSYFAEVEVANGVSLDFADAPPEEVHPQHYAFLIGEEEFDAVFERVRARGLTYYAYQRHREPGAINHRSGGRGFYFDDPSGHHMEVLTRVGDDGD